MERFPGENQPKPTPAIQIEMGEGQEDMVLTWFNTTIRLFEDPQFNHVEYRDETGHVKGITVTKELMDMLFERTFPQYSLPFVDDSTYDWYVRKESIILDFDINTFEHTGEIDEN